jgi:hypothetical protein
MRKRKDVLNGKLAIYDTFVNNLYDKANANHLAWNIPATVIAAILALLGEWNARWAISKVKSDAKTGDRKATATARSNLTKYLRPFVLVYIMHNENLADDDIVSCGLLPYDKTRTRIGRPDTVPVMEYRSGNAHTIDVFYRQGAKQKGVQNRGKPFHVASCKVAYFIGDNPPADPKDFTQVILGKSSPIHLVFNAELARKKITFAACWVSESLLDGNWTVLQTRHIT